MVGLGFSNIVEPHDYALLPSFNAYPRRPFNGRISTACEAAQALLPALEYPGADIEA
jgi:hypothetical protein